jgi:phosphoribosylformylglycinamidine synthase
LVVLPGGFSYGDYLRCGAMAAHSPVTRAVKEFAARGGHVLGVCNGFQTLCEAGCCPARCSATPTLRFLSMDCWMRVERTDTPFTNRFRRGDTFRATMAHGDGNYFADEATLDRLEGETWSRSATPPRRAATRRGEPQRQLARHSGRPLAEPARARPHAAPENQVDPAIDGTDGLPLFESLGQALRLGLTRRGDRQAAVSRTAPSDSGQQRPSLAHGLRCPAHAPRAHAPAAWR